ncbi:MAG: DNA polymerase III subunit delta' [Parvularculaceae bacterium]
MSNAPIFPAPHTRLDFLHQSGLEAELSRALNQGALANGWLITGAKGIGKSTLAYKLARSLLHDPVSPTLESPAGSRAASLIAARAHPDLFVAERIFDEKKERYAAEISVETMRDLTHFLNHTPSMGGWRVAIIDTADDLNRSSANALLKALEEPPPRTALFLLSAAPGRLLATIRSRCRRIAIRPYSDEVVATFLERESSMRGPDAMRIAKVAEGRPGFALRLAAGDGPEALNAVDEFLSAKDAGGVAARLSQKNADGVWLLFQEMILRRIDAAALAAAKEADARAGDLVRLRETVGTLFTRGDALNLDRLQIVLAAARVIATAPRAIG